MARGLSPVFLVSHGLEAAILELVANTEEVHGIACSFDTLGHINFNENKHIIHLFLIVQEAVSNCVRHSEASNISIRQEELHGRVRVVIEDDGIGFSRQHDTTGMGLKIMRYRAERIGAEIDFEPRNLGGSRVIVTLHDDVCIKDLTET